MLRVSYDLYTSFHLSFCLFYKARHRKVSLFFGALLCSAEEIKDNKLYRIGIKMKKSYYTIYLICVCMSVGVCMCVCASVFARKEQVRKKETDGIKLKKEKTPSYTFI